MGRLDRYANALLLSLQKMTLKVLVKDTAQCLSNLMKCYTQADLVEGEARGSLCVSGGPGHSVWHLSLTPTPDSLLSARFRELPKGRPAFACKVQWQRGELKIVTPGPRRLKARGADLNDMFAFHKHGLWSPGGAGTGGAPRVGKVDRVSRVWRPELPAGIWAPGELVELTGGSLPVEWAAPQRVQNGVPRDCSSTRKMWTPRKGWDPKTPTEASFLHHLVHSFTMCFWASVVYNFSLQCPWFTGLQTYDGLQVPRMFKGSSLPQGLCTSFPLCL